MAPTYSLPPATVPEEVTWAGSEAVIRLQPGPVFSGSTVDYFAPTNWASLDSSDDDLGGSGPVLVDVPGATPSALVVPIGKDGKAYLLNRNNLGGVSAPLLLVELAEALAFRRTAPIERAWAPTSFFAPRPAR